LPRRSKERGKENGNEKKRIRKEKTGNREFGKNFSTGLKYLKW
jgi:hypothetical protein